VGLCLFWNGGGGGAGGGHSAVFRRQEGRVMAELETSEDYMPAPIVFIPLFVICFVCFFQQSSEWWYLITDKPGFCVSMRLTLRKAGRALRTLARVFF
jgi:hypothetical protein